MSWEPATLAVFIALAALDAWLGIENRRLRSLLESAREERAILRRHLPGSVPETRLYTRAGLEQGVRDYLRFIVPAALMVGEVKVTSPQPGRLDVVANLVRRPWRWGKP